MRTLVDPEADERLHTHGYATMPVLGPDEVAELRAAYHAIAGGARDGMVVDYTRTDRGAMEAVNALLDPVWERHLGRLFVDHRCVFSTFAVKYPGPSSMFLHEDRSWVDERRFRSGTLWIPLVDASPERANGCLHVIPGSHRLGVTFSGTNTPDLFRPYERTLERRLEPVPVAAGDGLFYDTRALHSSPDNRSDEPREAIVCSVAPREAGLIHAVGVDARRRRLHRVDRGFFLHHAPQDLERRMPDEYPVIEELDEEIEHLDPALVAEVCGLDRPVCPSVLCPPELVATFHDGPRRPSSEFPHRIGGLVPLPVERATAVRSGSGARLDGLTDPDRWPPASLIAPLGPRWAVGDPRATDLGGSGAAVLLHPNDRLCLRFGAGRWSRAVLAARVAAAEGAGVVGRGFAAHLEVGTEVELDAGEEHVLWNHGPGPLVVAVVGQDRSRAGWRGLRALRRREPGWRRLAAEAEEALDPAR